MIGEFDASSTAETEQEGEALATDLSRGLEEPSRPSGASTPAPAASSSLAGSADVGSYVNSSTFFKGLIKSSRSVGIDGKFEGEIQSEADVVIGRDAEVRGNVKAETVIISGKLVGNVTCSMLEVQPTARVIGNLTPGQMLVAIGAVVRGQVFMGGEENEELPEPLPEQTHSKRRGASAA